MAAVMAPNTAYEGTATISKARLQNRVVQMGICAASGAAATGKSQAIINLQ
jgi:hypothetical protein